MRDVREKKWVGQVYNLYHLMAYLFLWFGLTLTAQAETLQTFLPLSPTSEIPPVTDLNATATLQLTLEITRNASGAITNARMSFLCPVRFPGGVNIQGLHLREGDARTNGNVRFDSGLSSSNAITFSTGEGVINREIVIEDLTTLARLLAQPSGFYANLHSQSHPSGALRGQLTRFTETLSRTVSLSPAQEVPPVSGLNATGTATMALHPTRNTQGEITGGSVTFTVAYDFPAAVSIRGLHVHEAAANAIGPIRFDTGLSATHALNSVNGKGYFNHTVPLTDAVSVAALTRMLVAPAGFYVNLHTAAHPNGALRGQLESGFTLPPLILQANDYALTIDTSAITVNLLTANTDSTTVPLINGQPAQFTVNAATGQFAVQVPAALRANAGVLALQMRNGNGAHSPALFLNVQAAEAAAAVTDAAGYGPTMAPESIGAIFGIALASQIAGLSSATLPNTLDGTTVYVNGTPAPLFFVSPGQINFLLPERTLTGPATVIIRTSSGSISLARLNLAPVSPGVFTRLANGRGAPAAIASTDNGQTFTLLMSNADGTPVEIQVGHIAVLFGTGFRFQSGAPLAAAAGLTLTPIYAGSQGQLVGLDQINFVIPETLRGKGETDLVFQFDGQSANAIRIKVR
jgi:uncharacterized protein (TIGR03437 family)